mmetsp:Transcript_5205/g.15331  ORF Transcript_5205/g.15331 Transcript_5205/m.15331 type:complete len:236 (-) Transcript_5205:134-841(-)
MHWRRSLPGRACSARPSARAPSGCSRRPRCRPSAACSRPWLACRRGTAARRCRRPRSARQGLAESAPRARRARAGQPRRRRASRTPAKPGRLARLARPAQWPAAPRSTAPARARGRQRLRPNLSTRSFGYFCPVAHVTRAATRALRWTTRFPRTTVPSAAEAVAVACSRSTKGGVCAGCIGTAGYPFQLRGTQTSICWMRKRLMMLRGVSLQCPYSEVALAVGDLLCLTSGEYGV